MKFIDSLRTGSISCSLPSYEMQEPRALTSQKPIFSFSHTFTFLQMAFSAFLLKGTVPVALKAEHRDSNWRSEDLRDRIRNWSLTYSLHLISVIVGAL